MTTYINLDLMKTQSFKDRYDLQKFMKMSEDVYDITDSYFCNNLTKLPIKGKYTVTADENRPELISYKIYGTTHLWYLLLLYNNIMNFDEVSSGTVLNYPAMSDLEEFYFSLNIKQKSGKTGIYPK